MEIIAHRGYWKDSNEKNQMIAFQRALHNGIGTETDFRDYMGTLKISHNIAEPFCVDAIDFFSLYQKSEVTLAINIKADGLQRILKNLIEKYEIKKYFCFDMSIPDALVYKEYGLNIFIRESEYEKLSDLYHDADGVWMDGFISDTWITRKRIIEHLKNKKRVCIVSPELHGRDYRKQWEIYRYPEFLENPDFILCTDCPQKAKEFFYGKN